MEAIVLIQAERWKSKQIGAGNGQTVGKIIYNQYNLAVGLGVWKQGKREIKKYH